MSKKLRLVIADEDGNVYEVVENLNEYDVTKEGAKIIIMKGIKDTLDYIADED